MVTRLYGKCDSADIVFTQNADTGRWETAVPASDTGVYIIEIWAEDDAGNTAYYATVKLSYDPSKLCFRLDVLDVGATVSMQEVLRLLGGDEVSARVIGEPVNAALEDDPLRSKIIKCEVCGQ